MCAEGGGEGRGGGPGDVYAERGGVGARAVVVGVRKEGGGGRGAGGRGDDWMHHRVEEVDAAPTVGVLVAAHAAACGGGRRRGQGLAQGASTQRTQQQTRTEHLQEEERGEKKTRRTRRALRGRLNKRSQRTEPESHSRVDATDEGAYNPTVTINPPHQKSRNF